MPKSDSPKLTINLDLLKPQSNPEKLFTRLFRWLLSSGRYIFIFVESLVLIAFVARFKLDADLSTNKDKIEEQIPYIESLKSTETLIKQTQLKLSTISSFRSNNIDYSQILKKIADQTPSGVKLINLSLQKEVSKVSIQLTGLAQNNNDLSTFIYGLKQDPIFQDVALTTISLEHGNLNFSVSAQTISGGKNL